MYCDKHPTNTSLHLPIHCYMTGKLQPVIVTIAFCRSAKSDAGDVGYHCSMAAGDRLFDVVNIATQPAPTRCRCDVGCLNLPLKFTMRALIEEVDRSTTYTPSLNNMNAFPHHAVDAAQVILAGICSKLSIIAIFPRTPSLQAIV